MKTLLTISIATVALITLSSCCGPYISKGLSDLPPAPIVAESPYSTPIEVTPTK